MEPQMNLLTLLCSYKSWVQSHLTFFIPLQQKQSHIASESVMQAEKEKDKKNLKKWNYLIA